MSNPHENPPAFPIQATETDPAREGMTLRDYFAGQAMAGMCGTLNKDVAVRDGQVQLLAFFAYELADAMLKARGRK
jgi:hypothetical protein